ncbi:DUF983 domain-containing protein [bacterium]|nr:MAG: DUF983 domain-containing protein [bacterium]
MEKVSKAYAMIHAKCPRCRKGDMFAHSMYGLHAQHMYKTCPYCGFVFEQEPGYFYVSMFASYALNVAEMVSGVVAIYVLTGKVQSPWLYIAILLGISVLLSPFNFRYSRVMLLYWLTPRQVKYHPEITPLPTYEKGIKPEVEK